MKLSTMKTEPNTDIKKDDVMAMKHSPDLDPIKDKKNIKNAEIHKELLSGNDSVKNELKGKPVGMKAKRVAKIKKFIKNKQGQSWN